MIVNGKILNNEHIQQPTLPIDEWLKKHHTPEEIQQRLRLGDSTLFDTQDDSKELSVKELENMRVVKRNPVTIFQRDKIVNIANELERLRDDLDF